MILWSCGSGYISSILKFEHLNVKYLSQYLVTVIVLQKPESNFFNYLNDRLNVIKNHANRTICKSLICFFINDYIHIKCIQQHPLGTHLLLLTHLQSLMSPNFLASRSFWYRSPGSSWPPHTCQTDLQVPEASRMKSHDRCGAAHRLLPVSRITRRHSDLNGILQSSWWDHMGS